jgi:WD40 repeat protein
MSCVANFNPNDCNAQVRRDVSLSTCINRNRTKATAGQSGHAIQAVVWQPDGRALAVGMQDGHVELYDVETGLLLHGLLHAVVWIEVGTTKISFNFLLCLLVFCAWKSFVAQNFFHCLQAQVHLLFREGM